MIACYKQLALHYLEKSDLSGCENKLFPMYVSANVPFNFLQSVCAETLVCAHFFGKD